MNNNPFHHLIEREESHVQVDQQLKSRLARKLKISQQKTWSMKPFLGFAFAGALVLIIAFSIKNPHSLIHEGTDDWQYQTDKNDERVMNKVQGVSSPQLYNPLSRSNFFGAAQDSLGKISGKSSPVPVPSSVQSAELGFSTGGAKDIGNFRENINNGYLPLPTDVTYEGLFYDYSFDTGKAEACNELFCPSYARAIARDPLSGSDEYYLSVGLNSNIKESDFQRPKTNFVVVLDISGSMSSSFDQYYYDQFGGRVEVSGREANKSKMQLATESLQALVDHVRPDDRLGIVLFSDSATVAKPLRLVRDTNLIKLKQHIGELGPTGGTNMSAGIEEGTKMLQNREGGNDGYANRLIFITDAMPNQGEFGAQGLHGLAQKNAEQGIDMSFMGIGVDFQSELVEALTKVRGANYLSIHSAPEFKKRLGEEFDFLVTPMVYDLKLNLESSGFAIDKIYGSPDADLSSGNIMHVRTLFPSKTENGETKGGLVLIKLRKTAEQPNATLKVSYEDTKGGQHANTASVSFEKIMVGSYDNLGIRKGIVLSRYAELLKQWLSGERGVLYDDMKPMDNWERTSTPLRVSNPYQSRFQMFREYLRNEINAIHDSKMDQEMKILDKLVSLAPVLPPGGGPIPVPMPVPIDDWKNP